MEESKKQLESGDLSEEKSATVTSPVKTVTGDFEDYLINALNDSLMKKSKVAL